MLPGWPPATVIDLRGNDEHTEPHPLARPHTTVHTLPLLDTPVTPATHATSAAGDSGKPARPGQPGIDWASIPDLATAYLRFLDRGAAKIAHILDIVAAGPAPILIHCTAGKDRTGVVVAVLLRAAGVTRSAITSDYRATEPALPAILARSAHLTTGLDPTMMQRLMGVPAPAITAVLDHLDHAPGGVCGWLSAAGADPTSLATWCQRITRPHPQPAR
jgi:protein-tyrosine phosphatase